VTPGHTLVTTARRAGPSVSIMKLFVALALLALPSLGHADAKYTRKHELHIDVHLSDRTKPIAPSLTPAKPRVTADDVLRAQTQTQPMRVEQEAILVKLIAETPDDDPDKPDLMFRLAEQYAQQLRYWNLKSIDDAIRADRLPK
jgi:hypothetical protein